MDNATKIIRYQNWVEVFREWSNSGLSKTQFCRERGIQVKSLFLLPTYGQINSGRTVWYKWKDK